MRACKYGFLFIGFSLALASAKSNLRNKLRQTRRTLLWEISQDGGALQLKIVILIKIQIQSTLLHMGQIQMV